MIVLLIKTNYFRMNSTSYNARDPGQSTCPKLLRSLLERYNEKLVCWEFQRPWCDY